MDSGNKFVLTVLSPSWIESDFHIMIKDHYTDKTMGIKFAENLYVTDIDVLNFQGRGSGKSAWYINSDAFEKIRDALTALGYQTELVGPDA